MNMRFPTSVDALKIPFSSQTELNYFFYFFTFLHSLLLFLLSHLTDNFPANIYLFKINNRNTEKGVKYV